MQSRGIMMPNSIIIWFNRNGICRTKQNQVANCQDAVFSLAGSGRVHMLVRVFGLPGGP